MKDNDKTKKQLIEELTEMRRRITELEKEEKKHKKAEDNIRITELRLRSLIQQTTDSVFCYEFDPPIPVDLPIDEQVKLMYNCILTDCNLVCARSYGADRVEDVIGRKLTDLFGTMPGSLDTLFRKLIEGGYRIDDGEGVEILPDGTERFYLNNGYGVVENGKLLKVWGTFRDITERKHQEEELRESEERFSKAFRCSPDAVVISLLEDGRIIDTNDGFERITGHSSEEARGKTSLELDLWVNPADRTRFTDMLRDNGKVHDMEVDFRRKSGGTRSCLLSAELISLGGRKHIVTVGKDITELHKQRKALKDKNIALREVIGQTEAEKNKIKEDITINVDKILLPIIKKLRIKGVSRKYSSLLEHYLKELASSFGRKITKKSLRLTAKEIEICNMIRGGLTSKDIAGILNISCQTVDKHRKNIRKKLGVSHKEINLYSFLQRL